MIIVIIIIIIIIFSFLLHSLIYLPFSSSFFCAQVIIFKFYPYWSLLFWVLNYLLYQIFNKANFIVYKDDLTIRIIWKRQVTFVFVFFFL